MNFEQSQPFLLMSVLDGAGSINGVPVKKGVHLILPNGFGHVKLLGNMEIVASSVGSGSD
jgi:uncharacterized protein YjlB